MSGTKYRSTRLHGPRNPLMWCAGRLQVIVVEEVESCLEARSLPDRGRAMHGAIAEESMCVHREFLNTDKAAAHTRQDPGTRIHCCRCSLPGLAGFTISRRGETGGATITMN